MKPFFMLMNLLKSPSLLTLPEKKDSQQMPPVKSIDLAGLLENGNVRAFRYEIQYGCGMQLTKDEVTHLFDKACLKGDGLAVEALADRYPSYVNARSVSKVLRTDYPNETLVSSLLEANAENPNPTGSLQPLFNAKPDPDVVKIFMSQARPLSELLSNLQEGNTQRFFFRNRERDDSVLAAFEATVDDAPPKPALFSAKNATASAMLHRDGNAFFKPASAENQVHAMGFPYHFAETLSL